jgi:hypothetical protein
MSLLFTEPVNATTSRGPLFRPRPAGIPGPVVCAGLTKAQAEELLDRLEADGWPCFALLLADASFVVIHW